MTKLIARLVGGFAIALAQPVRALLDWAAQTLEDEVSKESEALEALDASIAAVEAWKAADDETDATAINERTARINALLPSNPSHLPVDPDGNPVAPGDLGNQGPAAPVTSAPETSSDADDNSVDESEQQNV